MKGQSEVAPKDRKDMEVMVIEATRSFARHLHDSQTTLAIPYPHGIKGGQTQWDIDTLMLFSEYSC